MRIVGFEFFNKKMMFSFANDVAKERTDELMNYAMDKSQPHHAQRFNEELSEIMDEFGNFDYSVIANTFKIFTIHIMMYFYTNKLPKTFLQF